MVETGVLVSASMSCSGSVGRSMSSGVEDGETGDRAEGPSISS